MQRLARRWFAVVVVGLALGCGGVREDRVITFSHDGGRVGFQHGRRGVFVADKDGSGLVKVFTPGDDVLATSPPLWAPDDRRLIFATARPADGQPVLRPPFGLEPDPAGDLHFERPVVFTCWLRDGDGEPKALFDAHCDHVGAVAAGLAVRWHPDGRRILYLDRVADGCHAIFEFDLKTHQSTRLFPAADTAKAVAFDWSPDGKVLTCVLAGTPNRKADGVWVRGDAASDWWQPRVSHRLAVGETSDDWERVKATRPAWSPDGTRFVFATGSREQHTLWMATLDGRRVEPLRGAAEPMHAAAWHSDGKRIAYLLGREKSTVQIVDIGGAARAVAGAPPARSLAGWDASGRHLAYVTADEERYPAQTSDSLLLQPVPAARDAIHVVPSDDSAAGRVVFSGMRATFLRWSPNEEKLSLWLTFAPTYRSVLSDLYGWGLRRGDPAAVLDVRTGAVSWMAVDAGEKAQIGHYYLLKGKNEEALRWYDEAERARPVADKPDERLLFVRLTDALARRDAFAFFHGIALRRLGRDREAAARCEASAEPLRRLTREVVGRVPEASAGGTSRMRRQENWRGLMELIEALYRAEVFLSLDAAEEGERFFRDRAAVATTEEERLASAFAMAQLLLIRGKASEYVDFVADDGLPRLSRAWEAAGRPATDLPAAVVVAGLALTPLRDATFLTALSVEKREKARRITDDPAAQAVGRTSAAELVLRLLDTETLARLTESSP